MIHKLTLHAHFHSTTTLIFHPSTSTPSRSNSIALTRSTLAVGCNSKSPFRTCSNTSENLSRISPFAKRKLKWEPGPRSVGDKKTFRIIRTEEARRVASRISLGQDDLVGVKIAMRAVSASECLSSRRISTNRLEVVTQRR